MLVVIQSMNLKHLTDKTLLHDTKKLPAEYRSVTAQLLHHLREIENRRLFCDLGYSSLFNYVVQELGFSEPSAARRIKAARLLNEIPEIESKIESGDLNLSIIGKAADAFKSERITDKRFKLQVLETLENTSARLCEKALLEITGPKEAPKKEIRPLTSKTNLLSVTLTDEELKLYEDLKSQIQIDFWKTIFNFALRAHEVEKYKTLTKAESLGSSSRYIPTALKKAIYERDKVCTLCGSKHRLEYDHIRPYSMGGKTEYKNLRLLCRSCNQRQRIKQRL